MTAEAVTRRAIRAPGLALALLGLAACAQEQPPPGAHPDLVPPEVVRISPAPDSIVPGFDGSVSIRFNEPIQPPGDLSRQLKPSVAGLYEMDIGFSGFDIEPRDDWFPDAVYCFQIPAGISDLLRNQTRDAVDFCFSTGVPIEDTRLSGTVLNPETGQAMAGARVLFHSAADTTPYTAETDAEGAFSIRGLPPRPYWVIAFTDRNRDFALDGTLEPSDSISVDMSEGSATPVALRPLEPDSTPPLLARGEVVDSITLRLEFDDALQRLPIPEGGVIVTDSASGQPVTVREAAVGEPGEALTALTPGDTSGVASVDSVAAGDDSARVADSLAAEPPAGEDVRARSGALPVELDPGQAGPPAQDALPSRVVSVRLARPLAPGVYRIVVEGVRNLRELEGGGELFLAYEPPADVVTDSAAVEPSGAPDSLFSPSDTLPAVADSPGSSSETLRLRARRR